MIITTAELEATDLSRTCDKHGLFTAKVLDWPDGKHMVVDSCATCSKETREAEEALEAEEYAIDQERLRKSYMINHGISPRYLGLSLSDIQPTPEQEKVYSSLTAYLEALPQHSLIIAGTVGTGKTFLAQALAQDLRDTKGKDFIFSTARQVVRDIRSTWSRDSQRTEDEVIALHVNADYLFIDEIGIQYGTESEQIAMFDIINGRYEYERPTILISNLDIVGLKEIMGERIIDRLRQDGGELLAFNWKSLRT